MNAAYEEQETEVAPGRRRLIALAFVDVVGYSILMATNEASTHARWMQIMSEVLRPKAREHFGRIVKSTGDGVLAEFPSALDAVEWAQEIQLLVSESQRVAEPGAAQLALR